MIQRHLVKSIFVNCLLYFLCVKGSDFRPSSRILFTKHYPSGRLLTNSKLMNNHKLSKSLTNVNYKVAKLSDSRIGLNDSFKLTNSNGWTALPTVSKTMYPQQRMASNRVSVFPIFTVRGSRKISESKFPYEFWKPINNDYLDTTPMQNYKKNYGYYYGDPIASTNKSMPGSNIHPVNLPNDILSEIKSRTTINPVKHSSNYVSSVTPQLHPGATESPSFFGDRIRISKRRPYFGRRRPGEKRLTRNENRKDKAVPGNNIKMISLDKNNEPPPHVFFPIHASSDLKMGILRKNTTFLDKGAQNPKSTSNKKLELNELLNITYNPKFNPLDYSRYDMQNILDSQSNSRKKYNENLVSIIKEKMNKNKNLIKHERKRIKNNLSKHYNNYNGIIKPSDDSRPLKNSPNFIEYYTNDDYINDNYIYKNHGNKPYISVSKRPRPSITNNYNRFSTRPFRPSRQRIKAPVTLRKRPNIKNYYLQKDQRPTVMKNESPKLFAHKIKEGYSKVMPRPTPSFKRPNKIDGKHNNNRQLDKYILAESSNLSHTYRKKPIRSKVNVITPGSIRGVYKNKHIRNRLKSKQLVTRLPSKNLHSGYNRPQTKYEELHDNSLRSKLKRLWHAGLSHLPKPAPIIYHGVSTPGKEGSNPTKKPKHFLYYYYNKDNEPAANSLLERIARIQQAPAAVIIPGGLAALGLGLAYYYFNYVWYPTPIVTARLSKLLLSYNDNQINNKIAGADIKKIIEVFSGLESDEFNEEISSDFCRNRLVCQLHQDIPSLWEVTKAISMFLSSSLDSQGSPDEEAFKSYMKTAQEGAQGETPCQELYKSCSVIPLPLRPLLNSLFKGSSKTITEHGESRIL